MTVTVDDTNLKAIADAIRSKNGTEETYKPSEMAGAIEGIKSGGTVGLFEGTAFVTGTLKAVKIEVSGKAVESVRALRLVATSGTTNSIGSSGRIMEMFVDIINNKICFMQYVYHYESSSYIVGGNHTVNATITLNSDENSITVSSTPSASGVTASLPTGSWTSYMIYEG